MSNLAIGLLGTAGLFVGILLGVNVMVVLGLVGGLGLAALVGFNAATALLSTVFFDTTHSFHFSVIPLFLLMGFFAMRAGLGEDLFEAASKWLGGLRGGLAISTTLGAAAFGAASGSSVGTATVFTKLALPQMLDRGYEKSLASASIAIAGTLAVMIPPSALVVVYGILTDSSIGALLIAGFIPGIVFAVILCIAIWLRVRMNPHLAPMEDRRFTLREKLVSLRMAGPLVLIIVAIVSGLYLGIFTPTEAGGIGAMLTFILALIRHRGLKGIEMRATLMETVRTTAMIFAILMCALVFSKFLALSGMTNAVGDFLTGLDTNRWVIVALVALIYLALGMLMDAPALLAITLPITHPVMMDLGFDPVWFGIFVVLLVEIGAVTPPVGINCFVVQSASGGRVQLEDVFRGLLPFVLAGLAMLVLLCAFPQIALFLPERMR
ncbi:TRAP transporter large permease [Notoacmeibacter sp. MSK16QG-6]|uniref:TRAP transporter large permease n=1 Tax=Notoacmeibacter sp. MSK16QG-6 TaxID=2957982 RepID=UPI0020A11A8A|nr:TRAP transporter large permease [Notoacmeibacter sp. MSK16QG-6]MCP1200582.1 TRAP transporter large permease [Notoacmeibacter sp. MSK16QG-6]